MTKYVVATGWGSGYDCLPVVKQSAKMVTATEHNRERRFLIGDVIAILPKERAELLHARLVSSANRDRDEVNAANQRHRDRVAALKAEFPL